MQVATIRPEPAVEIVLRLSETECETIRVALAFLEISSHHWDFSLRAKPLYDTLFLELRKNGLL